MSGYSLMMYIFLVKFLSVDWLVSKSVRSFISSLIA